MTPKPICVIKVDFKAITPQPDYAEISDALASKMPDYHVFVVPNEKYDYEEPVDVFEFQVFYEKDFTEIQYQELRKLIEDSLPAQQPNC